MVPRSLIKRRIRDRKIESIGETHATVADFADIPSKLEIVIAMNPRDIICEVLDRSHTRKRMLKARGLEHETERDVIPVAIPAIAERLSRIAISEIVHPTASNRPGVTSGQTPRVIPHQRRRRVGQPLRKRLVIVYYVGSHERSLIFAEVEVQFADMRV